MNTTIDRRVALVSGASRGIGRATAIRLGQDFQAVAIIARSEDGLELVAREIRARGCEALTLPCDLKDPLAASQAVSDTVARLGRLDALATIAGDVSQADLFDLSDADWDSSLALKFHSMRRLVLSAWPHLRTTHGAVAITSGTSAITPKAALAAVGSINALITALAKAFAQRGQAEGVRVNSISPGPVMTDRRRAMLKLYASSKGLGMDAAIAAFEKEAGLNRYGRPEDIAEAFAWLLSPKTSWINGSNFRIDGGEIGAV